MTVDSNTLPDKTHRKKEQRQLCRKKPVQAWYLSFMLIFVGDLNSFYGNI